MGLLSNPLTVTVDSVDYTFTFLRQVPNEVAGLYVEPLAASSIGSRLSTSHTNFKSGMERHSLQRKRRTIANESVPGSVTADIVVTLSVVCSPDHTDDEVQNEIDILLAVAASPAGLAAAMKRGEI